MRSDPLSVSRRAKAADVQRESWARDPEWRRRRLAIGSVRACATQYPDDPTFEQEIIAALALGRAEGRSAAERGARS